MVERICETTWGWLRVPAGVGGIGQGSPWEQVGFVEISAGVDTFSQSFCSERQDWSARGHGIGQKVCKRRGD